MKARDCTRTHNWVSIHKRLQRPWCSSGLFNGSVEDCAHVIGLGTEAAAEDQVHELSHPIACHPSSSKREGLFDIEHILSLNRTFLLFLYTIHTIWIFHLQDPLDEDEYEDEEEGDEEDRLDVMEQRGAQ